MSKYILQAPNCWHQFQVQQQVAKRPLRLNARNGGPRSSEAGDEERDKEREREREEHVQGGPGIGL